MTTLATLLVKVGVDASDVDRQTQGVSQRLGGIGRAMSATVTPALIALGAGAVNAASDLGESINAIDVVFGKAADKIHAFGQTADETAGLSTRAFNELVTPVGAALQNVGFSADEAADASIGLAQRAADMASVFNTDVSEALGAIQAGLRGEADPLERFGVGLSDAAVTAQALEMGLAKTAAELDANDKAQARLALIMAQTEGIAGDFANTAGSVANQERIAAAEAENMAASFGQTLLPVKQRLIGVLRNVLGAFNGLSPGMQQTIVIAGGVVAAIGPLLMLAGSLTRAVVTLIPVFAKLAIAAKALWAVIAAHPFILIAVAIAALVVVVVKNWDTIKSAIITAWNAIVSATKAVWNAIVAAVKAAVGFVVELFMNFTVPGLIIKHWDTIRRATVAVWNVIKNAISTVINAIKSAVSSGWNAIKSAVSTAVNAVRSVVTSVWNAISSFISSVVGRIKSFVVNGFNSLRSTATTAIRRLKDGAVNIFRSLVSFVSDIPNRIIGFFRSLPGRLFDVGRNIIQSLINGIKSLAGAVGDAMSGIVSGITNLWPFSPAKEGPLRRFPPELAGANIGRLFAGGLLDAEHDVVTAAEAIARAAALDPLGAMARVAVPPPAAQQRVVWDITGADEDMKRMLRRMARTSGLVLDEAV